jgi:hypothetical protein
MVNMNSILLEGIIVSEVGMAGSGRAKHVSFVLSSWSSVVTRGKDERREIRVRVALRDPKLVERVSREARRGRGARVVGKIARDEKDSDIYIDAASVEYSSEIWEQD